MFHRDLNTFTFNKTEHLMYSRRAVMRKVSYVLILLAALQCAKLLFFDGLNSANVALHVVSTVAHIISFGLCIVLFRLKRFDIGKWLLQFSFLSFVTSAGFLWQADMGLHYFYLIALFVTGFMFNERETKFFIAISALNITLFLLFTHLNIHVFSTSDAYPIVTMLNSAILGLSCFACAWIVRRMTLSNWKKAQNFTQSQDNVVYKVFPERTAGSLISLNNAIGNSSRKSGAQDLMYKTPMTVVFMDIVNSRTYENEVGSNAYAQLVRDLFLRFDDVVRKAGSLRIKTQGDQYIFVCELKEGKHEARVCRTLSLIRKMHLMFEDFTKDTGLALRCGVATGEVSAGMVNLKRPCFDVWGQSVVVASRLEKSCSPMHVHCDKRTYELAQERFFFSPPAVWNFKGLGQTMTYHMALAS
ncbi:adenylate/guanylate cyclase domain-containing protein [Glaciecola siphonariae]|uniref:Adenylate/guanylate cyclase domain-containing protein n=1 Tax=Glaciecola siphonariae TaxID=521012 RepID=A0ABV9LVP8_9ALTE